MNNRITGVIRIYLKDRWGWTYLPWIILLSSFVVNFSIAAVSDVPITTGGLASIYIYLLVAGILGVAQTFPFAIGFTVRRKDYVIGTLATMSLLSAIFSAMLVLLANIEGGTGGWGVDLTFFNLDYLNDGGVFARLWVNFGFMLHLYVLGYLFGSIYRKFGRTGMFALFVALSLLLTVASFLVTYYDGWDNIGNWINDHPSTAAELSTYLLPLTAIYASVSYLLLRRAAV
ncbi:hypothetical protein [Cohnella yongneupensis]|uniref:ABC transporter permease n=1 Tax=Cohnella yongneupensis TaxID=425006 RepID=A0ABW0R0D0_9BACL